MTTTTLISSTGFFCGMFPSEMGIVAAKNSHLAYLVEYKLEFHSLVKSNIAGWKSSVFKNLPKFQNRHFSGAFAVKLQVGIH